MGKWQPDKFSNANIDSVSRKPPLPSCSVVAATIVTGQRARASLSCHARHHWHVNRRIREYHRRLGDTSGGPAAYRPRPVNHHYPAAIIDSLTRLRFLFLPFAHLFPNRGTSLWREARQEVEESSVHLTGEWVCARARARTHARCHHPFANHPSESERVASPSPSPARGVLIREGDSHSLPTTSIINRVVVESNMTRQIVSYYSWLRGTEAERDVTTSAEREREKSGRDRDIYHVFDIGTGRRRACQRRTDQTNQRPGITDVEASWSVFSLRPLRLLPTPASSLLSPPPTPRVVTR